LGPPQEEETQNHYWIDNTHSPIIVCIGTIHASWDCPSKEEMVQCELRVIHAYPAITI